MTVHQQLRPLERRVLHLAARGMDDAEIARRFRRSPAWAARVRALAEVPRHGAPPRADRLRPLERRVLRWREEGADLDEIAPAFRRSPQFLQQVEALAHYKLAR